MSYDIVRRNLVTCDGQVPPRPYESHMAVIYSDHGPSIEITAHATRPGLDVEMYGSGQRIVANVKREDFVEAVGDLLRLQRPDPDPEIAALVERAARIAYLATRALESGGETERMLAVDLTTMVTRLIEVAQRPPLGSV